MRWRMLLIAFLAQNLSFGLAFAAFGTLVPMMQATLGIGRTYAVTGLSLMSLSMGLLAPFAGRWLKRFGIRRIMLLGVGIGAAGYGMAALAQSGAALLLAYALLIGPALCLSGVIPASALATGWFDKGKGRALGVVNMPAMTVLAPPMVAWFVEGHGLSATFLMLGALQLALLPLLATIVEPPRQVVVGPEVASADMTSQEILRDRGFIILALGIGLLTMAGVGIVTHLVPLAIDRGLSLQQGALLLSAFGVASIFGAMASGWLVDRSGGRIALTLLALGWAVPWLLLLFAGASLPLLLIAAGAIGFFSGGINPLLTATMGQWLGAGNFGPAIGLCYFVKIPFLFAAAPFDGLMREVSGSYSAILLHIVGFALVAVLMLALGRR